MKTDEFENWLNWNINLKSYAPDPTPLIAEKASDFVIRITD